MSRVFVTGGSGLIGGALLTRLVERGDEVVALARSEAAAAAVRDRGAEPASGDVLDEDALAAGMEGCELVYHVAGVNTLCPDDPAELFHVNVRGPEAVARAAARARVPRIVFTSSAAAVGEPKGATGSEDTPFRGWYLSAYERSKREGEIAAFAAARRAGVELVAVNPSSVQGPGRTGGTGRILIAYLNGRLRAFVDTRISIVDIRDCIEGHLLAAERGTPGERYVLNGAALTSREALEIVSGITGVTDRVTFLPARLATAAAAVVEQGFRLAGRTPPVCREMVRTMVHGHRYDGSRAERELGLAYTPVRDTFARTVEWALAHGLVKRPLPGFRGAPAGYSSHMEREHPAKPEQKREGSFAEGVEREPDTPDEELPPDFARGARKGPPSDAEREGSFAEGAEELPDSPEKEREGSFDEGFPREREDD
jgi:dihydroflavonol-4-reductase